MKFPFFKPKVPRTNDISPTFLFFILPEMCPVNHNNRARNAEMWCWICGWIFFFKSMGIYRSNSSALSRPSSWVNSSLHPFAHGEFDLTIGPTDQCRVWKLISGSPPPLLPTASSTGSTWSGLSGVTHLCKWPAQSFIFHQPPANEKVCWFKMSEIRELRFFKVSGSNV